MFRELLYDILCSVVVWNVLHNDGPVFECLIRQLFSRFQLQLLVAYPLALEVFLQSLELLAIGHFDRGKRIHFLVKPLFQVRFRYPYTLHLLTECLDLVQSAFLGNVEDQGLVLLHVRHIVKLLPPVNHVLRRVLGLSLSICQNQLLHLGHIILVQLIVRNHARLTLIGFTFTYHIKYMDYYPLVYARL